MDQKILIEFKELFYNNSNSIYKERMQSYMKNKFQFLGINSPLRKDLMKQVFSAFKWDNKLIKEFVDYCWNQDFREMHYAGLDILMKHAKKLDHTYLPWVEHLTVTHSWWDTVDGIASNVAGTLLKQDKSVQKKWVERWSGSENIWLKRIAILHQLKYKKELDTEIMELCINRANGTKEFFLNKAIGWILREYSKTNSDYVVEYVSTYELSNLSKREALKWLERKQS